MPIDPEFLDLLVCPHPECHHPLRQPDDERLVCTHCCRVYPVRDGFPVLLLDEAWIEVEEAASGG